MTVLFLLFKLVCFIGPLIMMCLSLASKGCQGPGLTLTPSATLNRPQKANAKIYACTVQKEWMTEGQLLKPRHSQASGNETGLGAGIILTLYEARQCQQPAEGRVRSLSTCQGGEDGGQSKVIPQHLFS